MTDGASAWNNCRVVSVRKDVFRRRGAQTPKMETGEQIKKLENAAASLAESRPRHGSVLVVESDPDLQWNLARMLTVHGNRVIGTSSGDGALTVNEQWTADVAIVSSTLPGMPGIEVARRLRATNPDLLVILMDESVPADATEEPSPAVTARLPKPFRLETLRALLDSLQLTPAPAE